MTLFADQQYPELSPSAQRQEAQRSKNVAENIARFDREQAEAEQRKIDKEKKQKDKEKKQKEKEEKAKAKKAKARARKVGQSELQMKLENIDRWMKGKIGL